MSRPLRPSRWAGALGVVLYTLGTLVLPWLHLATHRADHQHGVLPGTIEWKTIADPKTGRVDLNRLATALGLQSASHQAAHAANKPHAHPGDTPPKAPVPAPPHGAGSLEHFSSALLGGQTSLVVLVCAAPPFPSLLVPDTSTSAPPPARRFLSAQRAQAPPVNVNA
jgi:hypothetical protein